MAAKKTKKDRVEKKQSPKGKVYISATFNNTLITVTDMEGNALVWGSSGNVGFKGTRKSTPFAATTATDKVIKKAKEEKPDLILLDLLLPGVNGFEVLAQLKNWAGL